MQALRYITEVGDEGNLTLPPMHLKKGTSVEIIVLVRDNEAETEDLLRASESSLDFWNNPIDDEVWNEA